MSLGRSRSERHCMVCGERFVAGEVRGESGLGYRGNYCPTHDSRDDYGHDHP